MRKKVAGGSEDDLVGRPALCSLPLPGASVTWEQGEDPRGAG